MPTDAYVYGSDGLTRDLPAEGIHASRSPQGGTCLHASRSHACCVITRCPGKRDYVITRCPGKRDYVITRCPGKRDYVITRCPGKCILKCKCQYLTVSIERKCEVYVISYPLRHTSRIALSKPQLITGHDKI